MNCWLYCTNCDLFFQQLLDDANQRNEKLREQLKSANQKILLLSQHHAEDGTTKR